LVQDSILIAILEKYITLPLHRGIVSEGLFKTRYTTGKQHPTALKVDRLYPVVLLVKAGWGKGTTVGK
jgi:hypothetical protein